jgi:molybdopterin/thiamine biosynthesis adenylyltransferase
MDHTRHIGIFNASSLNVTLVGAGGIGAITALTLAKMGVGNLTVYDGDVVSPENMPTQLHRLGTEDELKVEALQKTLALFGDDTKVFPVAERIDGSEPLNGQVIISAVDSITARQHIWKAVQMGFNSWYFDARMAAEEFHLYCVNTRGGRGLWYDAMISAEDDSRIADISCTEKATFHCAAAAAGIIGLNVRKILTGLTPKRYTVFNMVADNYLALGEA